MSARRPRASVVIASRNRKEELRTAIESAEAQSLPVEVLVIDDGSTDGTSEMVRREFPGVRLATHRESRGYIVRRNEAAREATGEVIVSIDDDAEFTSVRTIEQTLEDLDDTRIGAVAIPYIEPNKANRVCQVAPSREHCWVTDCFVGTAHAVRRDVFLALGGYREALVHQGEERDFCISMLAAGRVVRMGSADPIYHYESPKRDTRRMDYYGRRNDVLFAWHCVPMPYLPAHLAATTIKGIAFGAGHGRLLWMIRGMAAGYAACLSQLGERSPVPIDVYRLHRRLKKDGPLRLDDVIGRIVESNGMVPTT